MAYTPETCLFTLLEVALSQWSRPDAENPRLSAPISETATTVKVNYPLYKYNGTTVEDRAFLFSIKNSKSYTETCHCPAGGLSADGLTMTGVVRGIRLEGLDWTTGDSTLAVEHKRGDTVALNISGVIGALIVSAINGSIATGGTGIIVGTEPGAGGETITLSRTTTAGGRKGFLRWYITSGKTEFSNDGTSWNAIDDVSASVLVKCSSDDTTAGYLEDKVTVTSGSGAIVTKSTTSPAGNEKVNIDVALNTATLGVDDHLIYTPAYLAGAAGAEGTFNNWLAVLDGEFAITIDGSAYDITGIDFTGVGSMANVASYIQTAIRAATSGSETVAWSTDHFVITSGDTTATSAITVTSAVGAGAGTDISGAGLSNWMDCNVGSGTVTNAVVDRTADAGEVVKLDSTSGELNTELLEAELREAKTFFASTNISAAEAETLSDGSDATLLHSHSNNAKLLDKDLTQHVFSNSGNENTVYTYTVPGGTLSTNRGLKVKVFFSDIDDDGAAANTTFNLKYGSTTIASIAQDVAVNTFAYAEAYIFATATNAQSGYLTLFTNRTGAAGTTAFMAKGTATVDSTGDLAVVLTVTGAAGGADTTSEFGFCELLGV